MSGDYILHGASRSSATWRVRIALSLKGLRYREALRDLAAGEHVSDAYRALNPQQLVPTLECPNGARLWQSLAIVDYLDETIPSPPLLPPDAEARARVRALAQMIACDIHPINNMRVRNHVRDLLPNDPDASSRWQAKWSDAGFTALEAILASTPRGGRFAFGDAPGYFECFLIPQVGNARSAGRDMAPFPLLTAIDAACAELPAFQAAHPSRSGKS